MTRKVCCKDRWGEEEKSVVGVAFSRDLFPS